MAGFCHESGQQNDPGCNISTQIYGSTHFTLHGLWPQYSDKGYPQDCSNEAFDIDTVDINDMIKYWPNVQETQNSSAYSDFWQHEWSKHGTCSGLSQTNYFNSTISLIKFFGTPKIIIDNIGETLNANSIRNELGYSSDILCDNKHILTGAYTCWERLENGLLGKQIECKGDVLHEDTCDSTVHIL